MLRLTRALLKHASLSPRDFSRRFEAYARQLCDHPATASLVKRYAAHLAVPTHVPGAPPQKFDALDDFYLDDAAALAKLRASADWAKIEEAEQTLFVRDACIAFTTEVEALPEIHAPTDLRVSTLFPRGAARYERIEDRWARSRWQLVRALLGRPSGGDLVVARRIGI